MDALTLRSVTGLIYLVIIALWAAVLIPVWLRRHDQISEVRSTARFSSAMNSLGGRQQDPYVMEMAAPPRRSRDAEMPMTRQANDARRYGLDPTYERELIRQAASTRRAGWKGIKALTRPP